MTRRKWPVRAWITAALIGIFFIASTIGAALIPGVVTKIQDHCDRAASGCEFNEAHYR